MEEERKGKTPVIGAILMVAITIILAAVIAQIVFTMAPPPVKQTVPVSTPTVVPTVVPTPEPTPIPVGSIVQCPDVYRAAEKWKMIGLDGNYFYFVGKQGSRSITYMIAGDDPKALYDAFPVNKDVVIKVYPDDWRYYMLGDYTGHIIGFEPYHYMKVLWTDCINCCKVI